MAVAHTGHGVGAGGCEVKACHLSLARLLETDELPLIHHIRPQAFDHVGV